jgi:type IX secretion system PorP/SprF family membrane protein
MAVNIRIIAVALLLFVEQLAAQDFHFVNSFQSPQLLNPAATGSSSAKRTQVTSLYRGQWDNIGHQKAYQGAAIFADLRFCLQNSRKSYYALGIGVQRDFSTLGGLAHSAGMMTAAYHQHLGQNRFLSAGVNLGGIGFGVKPGTLKFDAQYQNGQFDPSRSNGEEFLRESFVQGDVGAGLQFYNNQSGWSLGASWQHLNQPLYSLFDEQNRLGIGMVLFGTYTLRRTDYSDHQWQIRGLYRRQSFLGSNSLQWQSLLGTFFQQKTQNQLRWSAGAYARVTSTSTRVMSLNALIPAIQLSSDEYSVQLSYDIDLARTRTRFTGGVELLFSATFGQADRCIVCARF